MERITLNAETRPLGKGVSRRLRVQGKLPAVLYGKSVKPQGICVDRREFEKATKTKSGMNVMIDLSITGGDSGLAFIRDYQADPFKRDFMHVDFQAISLDEKIEIEVPIELVGMSHGVKEGGVVVQARRTLHIRSLPDRIPDKIEIDITELGIGDGIHADEVTLPEGVEFPHTQNYQVVAVVPPAKEEVAVPVAAAVEGAEVAAPAEGAAAPAGEEKAAGKEPADKGGKA